MLTDNQFSISEFVNKPAISSLLTNSKTAFLTRNVTGELMLGEKDVVKTIRLAVALINLVLAKNEEEIDSSDVHIIDDAYYLVRSIDINDNNNIKHFESFFNIDSLSGKNVYYFILGTLGILSNNNIKVRIDLNEFNYESKENNQSWKIRLINDCVAALLFLIRKREGMADINTALGLIDNLKVIQSEYESLYLESVPFDEQIQEAYNLLCFYHVGKILTEVSDYLRTGYIYKKDINRIIQSHYKSAIEAIEKSGTSELIIRLFNICLIKIHRNSIWFNTNGLGSKIEILCKKLVSENIIDLLPSQQEAITQNLLDTASNVTVVQMPTSAGKSLLAEFKILQNLALNPDGRILYIVPNRALVNQVLHSLKEDLSDLDIIIEKTSRSNEIDPSEEILLKETINILISTPEKVDLLIRKSHNSVENVSLVIIDEAHTIQDGARGAKLELLLAMIKREMPKARFMLLSPFLPNAQTLTDWLATGRNAVKPISVAWKPADKAFIGISEKSKIFKFVLLPSAYSFNTIKDSVKLNLKKDYNITSSQPKQRLLELTAKHFSNEKSAILYLCRGKKTADKLAASIQQFLPSREVGELSKLVSKYIEEEAGCETPLSRSLKSRIAIHHAGLTDDTKSLVEHLIRKREIDHVCATTTVANGMNFPVSVVYFDDFRKGRDGDLSVNDFQNIVGRAGRTLIDNVGKIIFPHNSTTNIKKSEAYIKSEVNAVTSVLSSLLVKADLIINAFNKKDNNEERAKLFAENEGLSVLVQYLVHLLNVSKESFYANEIEDIFKDSYGYYSLDTEEAREKFTEICKSLYNDLQARITKGTLSLADKTGFSVPSIIQIMQKKKDDPNISSITSWEAENIFNNNSKSLSNKIAVIANLREVQLGTDSSSASFNPEQVAQILIGWVQGDKLDPLSKIHPFFEAKDSDDRMNDFISYLSSATFKSSWGLSVLEGIVKDDQNATLSSYIPSMIYYGVSTPKAVTMRMIGAPRVIADNLADFVVGVTQQETLSGYRSKINSLTSSDWDNISPKGSNLSGTEWKEITKLLTG